jgi:uncharacterized protein YjbI with pentapeptide repeats
MFGVQAIKINFKIFEVLFMKNIFKEHSWRWVILASLGIIFLGLIGWAQKIKVFLYNKWEIDLGWTPATLRVAIIAAPFAYFMWLWRDQNKIKDQKDVDRKIALDEREEKRLKTNRMKETMQNRNERKRLATQRVEGLVAKLSDTGLAETVRVHTAYQLRETLPADSEENQDIINILEVYRLIIAEEIYSNKNLAQSIQNIIVGFIKAGKYKWYIFRRFNFNHCVCSDIDLSGYKFEYCSFVNAKFENVNFKNKTGTTSKAISCDFKGAVFKKIVFKGVNFNRSDFSTCYLLDNIDFSKSNLYFAKFNHCVLRGNFTQAKFKNTEMWGITIYDPVQFDNDVKGVLYNIEECEIFNDNADKIKYEPSKYGLTKDSRSKALLRELLGEPTAPLRIEVKKAE